MLGTEPPTTRNAGKTSPVLEPGTLGRFVASQRALDAEVRSFLPAARLAVSELKPLVGSDTDVLALACADASGDGVPEVATLSRRRVTLGANARREVATHSREIAATGRTFLPVAARPLREPIASA